MPYRTRLPVENNRPLDIRRTAALVEKLSMSISSLPPPREIPSPHIRYGYVSKFNFLSDEDVVGKIPLKLRVKYVRGIVVIFAFHRHLFYIRLGTDRARRRGGKLNTRGHTDNVIARTRPNTSTKESSPQPR